MNVSRFFAAALALAVFYKASAELPPDIQKCRAGDVACIASTMNDVLRKHPNGYKELGLRNLEPVHLDELVVSKAQPNTPLNLDLKFTDLDMFGLSKAHITRVVGFEKDPHKSKFEIYLELPLLTLRGNYEARGKVLLLPVAGKGKAEINLKNMKSGVKAKLAITDENGKLHVAIDKLKVQMEPELLTVQMENLFGGNKELSDEMNKVINDNWKDIWKELESGIKDGYSQVVHFVLNDVLKTFTYDEIYSDS